MKYITSSFKCTSESVAVTSIYQKVKYGKEDDLDINQFKKSFQLKGDSGEKPKPILKYLKKSSIG